VIKVALLAPIHNSLYARLVANALTKEKDIVLSAVVVREHWNYRRFKSEFSRDGSRLFLKIYQKLMIGDHRYSDTEAINMISLAQQQHLRYKSLKTITHDLRIPYCVVPDHNHPKSLNLLKDISPDIIVFTGGGLLRPPLLEIPRLGILNCHTGILPQYRGMDVVEWTAVEQKINSVGFGVTLHIMDSGVDSGPILLRKNISPKPGAAFEDIRAELETLMVELMIDGVKALQAGNLVPQLQTLNEGRQYFVMHPRLKEAAKIRLLSQKSN
jgi:methionyl-tRNA formyltransferase